jgi:hypothetical protein
MELADGDDKRGISGTPPVSELHIENEADEMSSALEVGEVGEGKHFIAELEGSGAPLKHVSQQNGGELASEPPDFQKITKGSQWPKSSHDDDVQLRSRIQ